MNSLLIHPEEVTASGRALIEGPRARSVQAVHEFTAGVEVKAGVLNGKRGTAVIERLEEGRIELTLRLTESVRPRDPAELIVAVPRPQTVKKVLLAAAQFGVERVSFVKSHHTVKSYLQSHGLLPEAIRDELHKGLEQVWDTVAPDVRVFAGMREFFETADARPAGNAVRLLAEPGIPNMSELRAMKLCEGTPVSIAIGPEAGWTSGELEAFRSRGYATVSLGERMFRVETALTALLGQLLLLRQ